MNEERRNARIVKYLLVIGIVLSVGSSITAISFYSDEWPGLDGSLPAESRTFYNFVTMETGGLFILGIAGALCAAKLHYGNKLRIWSPKMARWNTIMMFLFFCFSILFPLGLLGLYYALRLTDKDFE